MRRKEAGIFSGSSGANGAVRDTAAGTGDAVTCWREDTAVWKHERQPVVALDLAGDRLQSLPVMRCADELTRFSDRIGDGMTRTKLEGFLEWLNRARLRIVEKFLSDLAEFLATTSPAQLRVSDEKVQDSIEEDMK